MCVITPTDVRFYSFKCVWDQMHDVFVCVYCMFCVCVKPDCVKAPVSDHNRLACQTPQKKENELSLGAQLSASQLRECVCVCMCACLISHT